MFSLFILRYFFCNAVPHILRSLPLFLTLPLLQPLTFHPLSICLPWNPASARYLRLEIPKAMGAIRVPTAVPSVRCNSLDTHVLVQFGIRSQQNLRRRKGI